MTEKLHKSYLKFSALVVGSFGSIFFLGSMISTYEPARFTLDLLSWPVDGVQNYNASTTRFLSALTGGFLFGWAFVFGVCKNGSMTWRPKAFVNRYWLGLFPGFV